MSPRYRLVVALSFLLGSAATLAAPVAVAGDAEIDRGGCESARSSTYYKLRVNSTENSRFIVAGVVVSDDTDEWVWKLLHNEEVSARGTVQARNADRSFKITRQMIDAPGTDVIGFRAENTVTGEVCRGELAL